ncbi:MAG: transporter permease protein [Modestobacter sp.]|nr:transporter permease protein [Modestobacter sp.]
MDVGLAVAVFVVTVLVIGQADGSQDGTASVLGTQLRVPLAWEAVLVAGVAAVLGVLLGGAYGLIGAASMLGDLGDIVLAVPWLQVAPIVVVATGAGLPASVLPASVLPPALPRCRDRRLTRPPRSPKWPLWRSRMWRCHRAVPGWSA